MTNYCRIILPGLILLLALTAFPHRAHTWNASAHAFIAGNCREAEQTYFQNYNVRMGSLVPDFFWYLRDIGLLDPAYADPLHGYDAMPTADPATPLYQAALNNLAPWNVGLVSFTEGIKTHIFADIEVHNLIDGYLEGPGMWVDLLQQKTGATDRLAMHLALEFSIDALLLQKYGSQIFDLLNTTRQGTFLDAVLTQLTGGLGFDVKGEFQKYIALMRTLERAADAYGPYLTSTTPANEFISSINDKALLDSIYDLSSKGLNVYLAAFQILRDYPAEIYETITMDMNWEEVIDEVIQKCRESQ